MAISENTDENIYKVFPCTSMVIGFQYRGHLTSICNNTESKLSLAGITGIANNVKQFRNSAATGTILVYFTETGLAHFSTCPSHELFNQSVSLDNLFPKDAVSKLEGILSFANSDIQRIKAVENLLITQLNEKNTDKLVICAVQMIYNSKGSIKMKNLHEQLYISQSAFEKRFRKLVGTSPKKFASIVPFIHFMLVYA